MDVQVGGEVPFACSAGQQVGGQLFHPHLPQLGQDLWGLLYQPCTTTPVCYVCGSTLLYDGDDGDDDDDDDDDDDTDNGPGSLGPPLSALHNHFSVLRVWHIIIVMMMMILIMGQDLWGLLYQPCTTTSVRYVCGSTLLYDNSDDDDDDDDDDDTDNGPGSLGPPLSALHNHFSALRVWQHLTV